MRTLKKVAALTLALATLFSISAFALDFKDSESIAPELMPDIELLNALEIMVGDNKGNFNPEGKVTRAEAAKMMYVLKLKRDDGATGWKGSQNVYKDTKGHWAEGYIAYCTSVGIVHGVGKGNFNPQATITGTELGKMLLVAAGYDAEKSGLDSAATWQANVLRLGSEVNLFDGYELGYTSPSVRQYAAKLFTNMLNTVPMVKYSKDSESFISAYSDDRTYGQQGFGLKAYEEIATENNNVILGAGTTEQKTSTVGGLKIKTNVPSQLLGQYVRVIYKDANKNDTIDATETVYGVYPSTKSTVYTVKQDAVTVEGTKIKFDGYNGGNLKDYAGKSITLYTFGGMKKELVAPADFGTKLFPKSFDSIKLVDKDNDGFIDSAFATAPVYAIINTFDSAKTIMTLKDANGAAVQLKNAQGSNILFNNTETGRENWKSVVFSDTVAKDDVVAITGSIESGKLVYTVKKLAPAQGKITAIAADGTVKMGDTYYSLSSNKMTGAVLPTASHLGKSFNIFTDGKYAIFAMLDNGQGTGTTDMTGNLAYVVDAKANVNAGVDEWGNPITANKVDILKADGTRAIYEYAIPKGTENAAAFATSMKDTVMEYVIANGKVYFKSAINAPTGIVLKKEANNFNKDNKTFGGYMTTEDSYFFVKSIKNYTCTEPTATADHHDNCDNAQHASRKPVYAYGVLKAGELKTNVTNTVSTSFDSLAVKSVNGLPTLVFGTIVTTGSMPNAAETTDYVFVTGKYQSELEGDTIVVRVPAQNSKGESISLKMVNGSAPMANKLYKVTTDVKGFSTLTTSDFTAGTVTGFGSNLVKFSEKNDFVSINNDTKIWYIDMSGKNPELTSGDGIPLATFKDDGDGIQQPGEVLMQNALYKLNNDGDIITDIFVEINGATITTIK